MKSLALGFFVLCLLMVSQRAAGSEVALPAGTAVSVTLVERIDSATDPFGKQYAASVNAIDGQPTAAGSHATVVLLHNNSGWLTQLIGLTVGGRKFQVLSSAGSLAATNQTGDLKSTNSILKQIGLASPSTPVVVQRVLLPAATQLRFRLIGTATAARTSSVSSTHRSQARSDLPHSSSPQRWISASPQGSGIAYLCRATDSADRAVPMSYYIADVFRTSDDQALVERRWHQYLVATYPYRFAHNPHAIIQCTRLIDSSDQNALTKLEGELKSQKAEIVETRWHYTLGPPPVPAASR